jgi:hypothetical protein
MAEKHRSTITAYETLAPDFASIKTPYALIYGEIRESFVEKEEISSSFGSLATAKCSISPVST